MFKAFNFLHIINKKFDKTKKFLQLKCGKVIGKRAFDKTGKSSLSAKDSMDNGSIINLKVRNLVLSNLTVF